MNFVSTVPKEEGRAIKDDSSRIEPMVFEEMVTTFEEALVDYENGPSLYCDKWHAVHWTVDAKASTVCTYLDGVLTSSME